MNKFLKLAIIPIAFLTIGMSTSCAPSPREIALITDVGDIDDGSFNQESWEAVKEYGEKYHKTYDFYRPFNDSDFARSCAVKQAVAKGAKFIVLPGFKFAGTCKTEYKKYPDVKFILLDNSIGQVNKQDAPNVCCVGFKCEYSGFCAGYTVATDLMKRDWTTNNKLRSQYGYGYCGGTPSKGVYEFGFGMIQGICRATADFTDLHPEVTEPQININYNYANVFAQDDNATAKMKGWLVDDKKDIKVLFPCGGKLYQSATEAVQHYNKHQTYFDYKAWLKSPTKKAPREAARWIGVDSDQYNGLKYDYEKKTIYTSALKGLKSSITKALELYYDGNWEYIGGGHEGESTSTKGEYGNGQWILGLHSIFGDYPTGAEIVPGDYVGIPTAHDEQTGIMRGFDNYTFSEREDLVDKLTLPEEREDRIPVYGGNGSEFPETQGQIGIPQGIVDWDEGEFRKTYLGEYNRNKILVTVI